MNHIIHSIRSAPSVGVAVAPGASVQSAVPALAALTPMAVPVSGGCTPLSQPAAEQPGTTQLSTDDWMNTHLSSLKTSLAYFTAQNYSPGYTRYAAVVRSEQALGRWTDTKGRPFGAKNSIVSDALPLQITINMAVKYVQPPGGLGDWHAKRAVTHQLLTHARVTLGKLTNLSNEEKARQKVLTAILKCEDVVDKHLAPEEGDIDLYQAFYGARVSRSRLTDWLAGKPGVSLTSKRSNM
jgi:hypothetical protein